jgi:integrase
MIAASAPSPEGHRTGAMRRDSGLVLTNSGLVFATRKGTPLDAQNIVNRTSGCSLSMRVPPIRFHDLRHTCATLLLGSGVNPKLVQHLLGYASITMTLDRHSHWRPSMGRHAAEGMDEVLG